MSEIIKIKSDNGHIYDAYVAEPKQKALGSIIVVQEIFGVTEHLKRVTESYADLGYLAICPSFFDRISPGIELSYSEFSKGREIVERITDEMVISDINAASEFLEGVGKIGVVGFCWGGAMVFLAAARCKIDCGVSYYGTRIINYSPNMKPKVPVQYHYGKLDASFPMDAVNKVISEQSEGEHFIYDDADHGFNCDDRSQYNSEASELAFQRASLFFKKNLI